MTTQNGDCIGVELTILMYHHITKPPPNVQIRGLYTTPSQFEGHIRYLLKTGFSFTNFQTLDAQQRAGTLNTSEKWTILTFDDGFLDNYQNAFPILKKYQVPAVIFPVVGNLGQTQVVWPESDEKTPMDLVSEHQLREMQEEGIEIGSHLMDHIHLDQKSEPVIREQLEQSKIQLEQILDKAVRTIAYPFGAYSPTVLAMTKEAGYRFGVTTVSGKNSATQPNLELKRVSVKGNKLYHPWQFKKQIQKVVLT